MKVLNNYVRSDLKVYEIIIAMILMFVYGYIGGSYLEREKQDKINSQLKEEYDQLRSNYDLVEIEYKWQLETCLQQLGDMQDDYDVNNDGKINTQDYVAIKNYIMNKDELGDQMNERAKELIEELSWVNSTDEELRNVKIINRLKKIIKELEQ